MSATQQNSRIVLFSLGALAMAMMSCAEPKTDGASIAFQISPGVTISTANYWVIAPDGKVTNGTVAVGASATVRVIISGLPTATGYQLIVSGLASDQITGCSGSATFNSPTPSTGIAVTLTCAAPPAPGQALVTATVNICPVIDGVAASPSSVAVGSAMALQVTAHDPDSGPAVLTYAWSASGGTLTGGTTATATFSCTQPGTFNISVAASDGDATCGVAQAFAVTCTEP
jgi:PKD domain